MTEKDLINEPEIVYHQNMLGLVEVSLHLARISNAFSWGCEVAEVVAMVKDLQYDLC